MTRHRLAHDYYTATVPLSPAALVDDLCLRMGLEPSQTFPHTRHYDQAARLDDPISGEHVASVLWGSRQADPLFTSTGSSAARAVPVLRALCANRGIEHWVTRADIALDAFDSGYQWHSVANAALTVAKMLKLRCDPRGDPLQPERGYSITLGAPSSRSRLTAYEKGKEQGRPELDWLRLETRIRPRSKADKLRLGQLGPDAAFAAVRSAGELAKRLRLPIAYTPDAQLPVRKRRDVDRARDALCRQYLPTLTTWLTELDGDPVALVSAILERSEELQRAARPKRAQPPTAVKSCSQV